jgi:isopentenyl phosphate kinase
MRDLILLKIGGSVCTEKPKGEFRVRVGTVGRIASEIAEARRQNAFRLIVVNGVGPFGHVNVKEYDIDDGLRTRRDFEGYVKTVCDCGYVNYMVSEAMRSKGLLALPYPSSSVIMQSRKRIVFFSIDPIKRMWDSNDDIIPVMNGTMVPDAELKGSVVSGDAVIEYLADRLRPKMVIFATDVDGIHTSDPHHDKKARMIGTITKENFEDIRHGISGSSNTDVTGGMLGKVQKLLSGRTTTLIVNGNRPGRVRDALLGKPVRGTVIKP